MNTLNGYQYYELFCHLKEAHESSGQPIGQGFPKIENEDVKEYIRGDSDRAVPDVVERISGLTPHKLLAYGAALNVGLPLLADRFFTLWSNELHQKTGGIFSSSNRTGLVLFFGTRAPFVYDGDRVKEATSKVKSLGQACQLPRLSSEQLGELYRKGDFLAREVLTYTDGGFTRSPEDINRLWRGSLRFDHSPHIKQQLILHRYSSQFKVLNLESAQDGYIKTILQMLQQLEELDVSNCVLLTSSCFSGGSPSLKKLVLTGTRINPEEIDKSKFPALNEIIQNDFQRIEDISAYVTNAHSLRHHSNDQSPFVKWKKLSEALQTADQCINSGCQTENLLCLSLERQPSPLKFSVMKCIFEKNIFKGKAPIVQAFINAWKSCFSPNAQCDLGAEISGYLVQLATDESLEPSLRQTIINNFCEVFKSSNGNRQVAASSSAASSSSSGLRWSSGDMMLLHQLLIQFRSIQGGVFNSIANDIWFNLKTLKEKLFHAKENACSLVNQIKFFLGSLVEISGHELDGDSMKLIFWSLKGLLEDPKKVTKQTAPFQNDSMVAINFFLNATTGKTLHPSTYFSSITPYTLAAAFAVKLPKNLREELLEHILEKFTDYQSGDSYPLCLLVAGGITDADIPESERDYPLAQNIKAYKGVASEDISPELKERYSKALKQGCFGGSYDQLERIFEKKMERVLENSSPEAQPSKEDAGTTNDSDEEIDRPEKY